MLGPLTQNIEDFAPIELKQFKPNTKLTFQAYVYFKAQNLILPFRRVGVILTPDELIKYSELGLRQVWIKKTDRDSFLEFQGANWLEPRPQSALHFSTQKLDSLAIDSACQFLMRQIAGAESSQQLDQLFDLLDDRLSPLILNQIHKLFSPAENAFKSARYLSPNPHALRVALLSSAITICLKTLFEPSATRLGELALAALFHDVGLVSLKPEHATPSEKTVFVEDRKSRQSHVEISLSLIERMYPELPNRSKQLIWNHHEKFDQSGYPRKKGEFDIDDLQYTFNLAHLWDTMMTGRWDGFTRTAGEALQAIKQLERTPGLPPEYFEPRFFKTFLEWIYPTATDR
jgi:response regulator RpfG family c-di-GMP phosphodiesterase